MYSYIYFYGIIVSLSFMSVFISDKKISSVIYVLSLLGLVFFSGFRYHTGWDWEAYDYYFDYINEYGENFFNYEIGFYLLSSLIVFIGVYPYFVFSAITIFIYYYVARIFLGWWSCLFPVAFLYYGYFQNFSILRQAMAAALVYVSLVFFIRRRFLLSVIAIIVSFSFHKSAVFILLFFPILFIEFRWMLILVGVLISIILVTFDFSYYSRFFLDVFSVGKIGFYLDNEALAYKVGYSLKYVEIVVCLLVGGMRFLRARGVARFGRYYDIALMGVFCELIIYSLFNDYSIFYERLSVYFEFFHGVFLVMLGGVVFSTKKMAIFVLIFLSVLVFFRYERLIGSPSRVEGELSHYERFFDYCNIFYPGRNGCVR